MAEAPEQCNLQPFCGNGCIVTPCEITLRYYFEYLAWPDN